MKYYEITLKKFGEDDKVIGKFGDRKEALSSFYEYCNQGLKVDIHSVEGYQNDRPYTPYKDTRRSYVYGRNETESL